MADDPNYKDAVATHGFKGTAIPGAKGSGEIGTPVNKGDLGTTFDTQAPIPQSIIIADKDGERVVARMDANALTVLRNANKGKGGAISYEQAAAIAKNGPPKEAQVPATAVGVAQPKKARKRGQTALPTSSLQPAPSAPASFRPEVVEPEPVAPPPKTKVKFVGPFGAISYPYTSVHREGPYLIMVQFDEGGDFFEAPMGTDLVEVHLGADKLLCYSGPQFRLAQDGQLFVTVYLVDQQATEERNRA
jgi:hypothetical protein